MTTLKTTSTPTIATSSTVVLDPGSAYQISVYNSGTVTVGVATNDFERAVAAQALAYSPVPLGGFAVRGNDDVGYNDGFSNTLLAPGQTRRIYPAGAVTAQNGSASIAAQVSLITWSP